MSVVGLRNITKEFGAVKALDGATMVVRPGEVVALIGDNAAGKSTLMKVLSGAYTKDGGKIFVDGKEVDIRNTQDARRLGIEMVYQDFALANNLDVAANIFMGRELTKCGFLCKKKMRMEAEVLIKRLGVNIPDATQIVESMSGGQRQAVAVARAMAFDTKLVIMDEPTASLSPEASQHILDLVLQLKEHGISVVYITHKIDELDRVADRVVRMKHGRVVGADA